MWVIAASHDLFAFNFDFYFFLEARECVFSNRLHAVGNPATRSLAALDISVSKPFTGVLMSLPATSDCGVSRLALDSKPKA